MWIGIISIFPEMFAAPYTQGVLGKAIHNKHCKLQCFNPRNFSTDKHKRVDDRPYGGGPGMVLMPEPLYQSITAAKQAAPVKHTKVFYLSPQGKPLTQKKVSRLATLPAMILLCGRYEGVDERLIQTMVDEEISLGDYILSGGELPALSLIDACVRLLPNVLGNPDSAQQDSFSETNNLLDHPHYTKPPIWRGQAVPEVLLSGNHQKINQWRRMTQIQKTKEKRSDLTLLRDLPLKPANE